ncbi:hypothetical protein F5B20DRAFT_568332 [Whalleya microplaca]|nr:hypothetical protein F5B20DRAFT_568332 [Whalleya microplaca]
MTPVQPSRLSIRKSLGISGCLVIVGGTLSGLAGLGFLIFLWTGHGADAEAADASRAWRAIMLNGWMTQATTLCALLIRTVTAAQATVCTAMLAALILEQWKVRKSQIVHFFVIRGINDGPLSLMKLVIASRQGIVRIESLLVFALTLSTIAIQFSSTILFSDLLDSTLVGDLTPVNAKSYINHDFGSIWLSNYEQEKPTNAIYGEVQSNFSSSPDVHGFSDAGLKQRVVLPFATTENRTAIRSFQGNAAVMNSRVVCMRPNIKGIYYNSHSTTQLCNSVGCYSANFNCSVAGVYTENSGPQSSFCSVGAVGWTNTDNPWTNNSLIYLIYASNMLTTDWSSLPGSHDFPAVPVDRYGEWSSYQILPAFNFEISYVDMVASGPLKEPSGNWSMIDIGDSSALRTFYGTDPQRPSPAERGILTVTGLGKPGDNSTNPVGSRNGYNQTLVQETYKTLQTIFHTALSTGGRPTWQGCILCKVAGRTQHPESAALFGDTLRATGRAADALQSFLTSFALTFYYEYFKTFQGTTQVRTTCTRHVQTAQLWEKYGCKGLISVASLLGFHLFCVLLTTFLSCRRIRYSRQGNVWHAVSQLVGEELREVLEDANDMDDDTLENAMQKEGRNNLVRLEKSDGGRINVVICSDVPRDDGETRVNSRT